MEETGTTQYKEARLHCKACRTPINSQAKLCPHCHTHQTESRWHKVAVALQWIAGAVTIVSLVVALNTLINFYTDWLEKNNTVKELTQAAKWLDQSQNYAYAWDLIEQALQLNPNNEKVRQYQIELAMQWLRSGSTRSNRKASYTEMADLVTPVLYRAITSLNSKYAATVFAHIGFAQYLKSRESAVFVDINELFAKALEIDNNNVYANVFRAYWLLFDHQHKRYDESMSLFDNAFTQSLNDAESIWINGWYLHGLNLVRDTRDDRVNHDVAKRLFALVNQRRVSGQTIESWRIRENMLRLFGTFGQLDPDIEDMLEFLPPEEYLLTLNWFTNDLGTKNTLGTQYVKARLNERLGHQEQALQYYKNLLQANPGKLLKQHIVDAYIRITRQPPQELHTRTYVNDPVPSSGDLWQFHKDSLLKFDFVWQPTNFSAALEYFQPTAENSALIDRLDEALLIFAKARDRIKDWIDVREREILRGNQHAYLKKVDEQISKSNLFQIMLQYGELAYLHRDWSKAIVTFEDTGLRNGKKDPNLLYNLALAYGQRAIAEKRSHDIKSALNALKASLDRSVEAKLNIDWEQIKAEPAFAALGTTKEFKKLIRGR